MKNGRAAKQKKLEGAARIKAYLLLRAGMNECATGRACGVTRDSVRRFHHSEHYRRMESGADAEALNAECKLLRAENRQLRTALDRAAELMQRFFSKAAEKPVKKDVEK